MNASESFELAAAAFINVAGEPPPGKHGCTHTPRVLKDWKIWCAAVEYMKNCRPGWSELLALCKQMLPPDPGEEDGPWWCPQCKQWLVGEQVTYEECCDDCGTYLSDCQPADWREPLRATIAKAEGREKEKAGD